MADFSIFEKLKIVFTTILSTPLFCISALLGIALIILMIICIIKKKKLPKWIYIVGWALVLLFIALRYTKLVPTFLDNLVDTFLKFLYFPSLGLYVFVVVISNIIFIILNVQKTTRKSYRLASLICAITLNVLFILVAGVMTANKIDIKTEINLYTNPTLLVLLQISMALFVIFILFLLFIKMYVRLTILDEVKFGEDYEYPEMDTYVNDNINDATNDEKDRVFVRKVMKSLDKRNKIKVRKVIKR